VSSPVGFLVVLLTFGALPADAQICAGGASFNFAPTHFTLNAGANRSGQGIGLSAGHGTDAFFGIVSGATRTVADSGRIHSIAGTLGTDEPLSPDNKFHICPMLTLGYVSDSNAATGDRVRFGASAAADAAMLAMNTPEMRVIPTISLDLRFNGVGRPAGFFAQDASRDDSTFSAGVGFVIWNRLSVVPRVVVPFGPVNRSGFQMTVGYNVLRR
jgi:hypothetical protein